MLTFLLYALLAWFLYKLVFGFIIPIYRATRQMKKKFRQMHSQMQDQQSKQEGFRPQQAQREPGPKAKAGDYIDFEEIK